MWVLSDLQRGAGGSIGRLRRGTHGEEDRWCYMLGGGRNLVMVDRPNSRSTHRGRMHASVFLAPIAASGIPAAIAAPREMPVALVTQHRVLYEGTTRAGDDGKILLLLAECPAMYRLKASNASKPRHLTNIHLHEAI